MNLFEKYNANGMKIMLDAVVSYLEEEHDIKTTTKKLAKKLDIPSEVVEQEEPKKKAPPARGGKGKGKAASFEGRILASDGPQKKGKCNWIITRLAFKGYYCDAEADKKNGFNLFCKTHCGSNQIAGILTELKKKQKKGIKITPELLKEMQPGTAPGKKAAAKPPKGGKNSKNKKEESESESESESDTDSETIGFNPVPNQKGLVFGQGFIMFSKKPDAENPVYHAIAKYTGNDDKFDPEAVKQLDKKALTLAKKMELPVNEKLYESVFGSEKKEKNKKEKEGSDSDSEDEEEPDKKSEASDSDEESEDEKEESDDDSDEESEDEKKSEKKKSKK